MKVRTKNSVKYERKYVKPGTVLDVPDEIAEQLIAVGAAESAEAAVVTPPPAAPEPPPKAPETPEAPEAPEAPETEDTETEDVETLDAAVEGAKAKAEAVAELEQVAGVVGPVAEILIANGITNIEGLQAKSREELAALDGISKKRARQIEVDAARFTNEE